MRELIFFDINGTLIERDERTDEIYLIALNELLGTEDAMAGVDNSARSDHDVFKEVLANHGMAYNDAIWRQFLDLYAEHLEVHKQSDIWRANVDVLDYLEELARTDVALALITGELSVGARYKLEKVGVWHHFPVGGFGEDGLERRQIAEAGLEKAKAHYGQDFDRIVVIGDTTRDIDVARHLGAFAVAITTGSHGRDQLQEAGPDIMIDRFADLEGIVPTPTEN